MKFKIVNKNDVSGFSVLSLLACKERDADPEIVKVNLFHFLKGLSHEIDTAFVA
jgi:hypothetical protein